MNSIFLKPKIAARWQVIQHADDEIVLQSLTGVVRLRTEDHQLLILLLDLLDGNHDINDILTSLSDYDQSDVLATLDQLRSVGVLEESAFPDETLSTIEKKRYQSQIAFFSYFADSSVDNSAIASYIPKFASEYQRRLRQACVIIFGLGRLGAPIAKLLAYTGIGHIIGVDSEIVQQEDTFTNAGFTTQHIGNHRVDAIQEIIASCNPLITYTPVYKTLVTTAQFTELLHECTFAIFCPDNFSTDHYLTFNLACLEVGTPWTSCRKIGFDLDFGPSIIPFKTPCYKCFDLRQKSNVTDYEAHLLEELYNSQPTKLVELAFTPGLSLVVLEVVKAITNFMQPATYAHICSLNMLTGELKRHPILKIPRCPHCGRIARGYPTIQAWQQTNTAERKL